MGRWGGAQFYLNGSQASLTRPGKISMKGKNLE
jgi:hypothetical protein